MKSFDPNFFVVAERRIVASVKGLEEQLPVIPSFARDKRARDDHAVRVRRKEHDTVFRLNRLNNVITNNEHVI